MQFISIYQWAGKFAIQAAKDSYPELELIQTESECGNGSNTWEFAEYIFSLLVHYIKNGAKAYVYWNMALAKDEKSTWGWKQNSLVSVDDKKVIFNPEFYVMKHFAKYVKRGAKLIEVKGEWSANALAFENSDGSKVLVAMNPFQEEKTLTLNGMNCVLEPHSFNTFVF